MDLIFHPAAAKDARKIASRYESISEKLVGQFWDEFDEAIERIALFPERHHYDASGLRRFNLKKFPFHILFDPRLDCIRVIVIRHNHRNPSYGIKRRF